MAFYPYTDDQSELTIQILKDMVRACVIGREAIGMIPLIEFAYNYSYQSNI